MVFSSIAVGFTTGDVTLTGTAGGTKTGTVTGSGTTYNVAVTGMTTPGTVIATIAAGVATDTAGNPNLASTSTDNTVTWDNVPPTVTINQAVRPGRPDQHEPDQLHRRVQQGRHGLRHGRRDGHGHGRRRQDGNRDRLGDHVQRRGHRA